MEFGYSTRYALSRHIAMLYELIIDQIRNQPGSLCRWSSCRGVCINGA